MASAGDVLTFQADNQAPSYQTPAGGVQEGLFQGYAVWTTNTTIELTPAVGDLIEIAGEMVSISGLTDDLLSTADSLLTALGGNSGNPMSADTTYYMYVSNSVPAYEPLSFRASDIPPAKDPSSGNILYLDPTGAGDGQYWRYVGIVRAYDDGGGGAEFRDDEQHRGIANYYNRRRKPIFVCPGYVDDDAETTYTGFLAAPGVWIQVHADAGITFVQHGLGAGDSDDGVFLGARAQWSSATNNVAVALMNAATTTAIGASGLSPVNVPWDVCVPRTQPPGATFSAYLLMAIRYTGVADDVVMVADAAHAAVLTVDPPVTYIYGDLLG